MADPATKEALRYRTAPREGFESVQQRPLATATAVQVCRTIKGFDMNVRKVPGTALAVYMLAAIRETADWTTHKTHAIRDLMLRTRDHVHQRLPGIYSRELVELVFVQPYCRIQDVIKAGLAQRQTASVHLHQLCDAGVLVEQRAGREKLFVHPKYFGLLTSNEHGFSPYAADTPATP